jgi:arsenical pump membrane protein
VHESLALLALLALLVTAVRRPRGLPEVVVAVPAVGLLLVVGAVSWDAAKADVERLGPVVGFLAAVLVLAECCEGEGLFRAAGGLMARASTRSASRLLLAVVVLASVTTALLSLDTTVVLLTPVVVATVRANGAPPRPHLYATAHLANSASLLLPVSNLTNLLAFAVVPVSFSRFAALMALPWLVAIAVETGGLRAVFRADFSTPLASDIGPSEPLPVVATAVVVVTVVGFAVASFFGLAPVWVATAGALVLSVYRLVRRRTTVIDVVRSTSPSFCLFVLGLGIVVSAVSADGLGRVVRHLVPSGSGLLALLGVAAVSAVLSNVMNNLPATLLLLPIAAVGGVGPALAVLIGVDIGPNLTYPGSLATLLWRRAVAGVDGVPEVRDFVRLGAATVPLAILGSTVALWLSLKVIGTG